MGSLISQNRQPSQPPKKRKLPPAAPTLADIAGSPVWTWATLADAIGMDRKNVTWLHDNGVPHRRAGKTVFISRDQFIKWIEDGSTSLPGRDAG